MPASRSQGGRGGFKQSGIGRELGPRGLEDDVEAEHIYLSHA
jgi:acyl-CoA reductase-like NAD-dependent aldehyde dehydrogenase